MDLNMRTIRYYDTALQASVAKEESADLIVPDLYPDIARILDVSGLVVIKEKNALDGRVELGGVVRANILYVPEGEQGLKRIDVSLPFSHVFEKEGVTSEVKLLTKAALLSAEARPINPRKVSVTVGVQLEVTALAAADWSLCEGIDDARAYSVQLLKSVEQAYMPVAVAEKTFQVSDEMEVPGSRPPVVDILKTDVRLLTQETKPIGNKLVLKGAALLKVLYQGPPAHQPSEEIHMLEEEIPFSQIIEMEELEESGEYTVTLKLCALEMDLRAGLSGESRVLGVNLQAEAEAVCIAARRLEAVVDLYSTAYDVKTEFCAYQITRLRGKSTQRQSVRESLETGQPVASVVDAQVLLWPVQLKEGNGEVSCDAVVKVVYLGDDQQFHALQQRLPVSLQLEAEGSPSCRAEAAIGGEVQATGTHDGIEVRFTVEFDLVESQVGQFSAVGAANVDTQAPKDHTGRPSVVLRRCRPGELLWNIAKKHNTTRDDLIQANHLSDEERITEERMMLIPRKR